MSSAVKSSMDRRGGPLMIRAARARPVGRARASGRACFVGVAAIVTLACPPAWSQTDPLPSWNDGAARQAFVKFVGAVTAQGSPQFVAPAARIAVFDNDGTLWSEQPMYVQGFFAFDRVKALAPKHPEWKTKQRSRASSRTT